MSLLDRLLGRDTGSVSDPPEGRIIYSPEQQVLEFTATATKVPEEDARRFVDVINEIEIDEIHIHGKNADGVRAEIHVGSNAENGVPSESPRHEPEAESDAGTPEEDDR